MGKGPRQVQRYITKLEKAGFVKRIERFSGRKQTSNGYSLAGLVAKLKLLEPEFTKAKEMKKLKAKKLETAAAPGRHRHQHQNGHHRGGNQYGRDHKRGNF